MCALPVSQSFAGKLHFGVGALLQNMGKVTASKDGSASLLGEIYVPTVSLSIPFDFFSLFTMMPSLVYTPLAKSGKDEVTKRFLILNLPALINLDSTFDVKVGPGLSLYYVGGPGGTATLNNGTTTATFYRPATTKHAQLVHLNLGVGVKMQSDFRMDLDFLVSNTFSKRRAFSALFQISKGIL